MFSNNVCVRELCGVANGLLMGESMPESWNRKMDVLLYKGKENVGVWQLLHSQVAGAWDESGGTCVREKIKKDG